MPLIVVNDEQKSVPDDVLTVRDLVAFLGLAEERVALELNGTVISRKLWQETQINLNDRVEIVHFVGGG